MIRSLAGVPVLLAGCASHTAQIAASANDARAEVAAARGHIEAALSSLDRIERAAADVHDQVGFVSDDVSPIYQTLQYASVAVALLAVAAVVYSLRRK